MDAAELERIREGSRAMWAAGDYPVVAERLRPVARDLVRYAGVRAGDRVLDVGTGSGSVAVAAAVRGAMVTGIDHIDTWFPAARAAAAAEGEGVTVDLAVADAEDLPYPDGAFDVVLSSFAHMFAPRHDVVAGEMARVCRPGGRVAFTVWAADGDDDEAFAIVRRALSVAPGASDAPRPVDTPDRWGSPGYAIERFARQGVDLTVRRASLRWTFASLDALDEFLLTASGPYLKAREVLEPLGRWERVWSDVRAANRRANLATDGTYARDEAYLMAVGTKGG